MEKAEFTAAENIFLFESDNFVHVHAGRLDLHLFGPVAFDP